MKNQVTISLLAICLCILSCSRDDKVYTQSDEKQNVYITLNENLAIYNATFYNDNNIPQTRGFWSRLRGYLLADASGALFGSAFGGWGALFGGIFSSATAGPVFSAHQEEYIDRPIKPYFSNIGDVHDPIQEEYTDGINRYVTVTDAGIGYQHNMILSKIEEKNPNIYSYLVSRETMATLITGEMKQYGYTIPNSDKDILAQKINFIVSGIRNSPDVDMITYLKNTNPEYSEELSVIDNFAVNVNPFINNLDNIKKYLSGFLQVIETSNLSNSQKELLKSCIEVAANSAVLWVTNTKDNNSSL